MNSSRFVLLLIVLCSFMFTLLALSSCRFPFSFSHGSRGRTYVFFCLKPMGSKGRTYFFSFCLKPMWVQGPHLRFFA